MHLEHLVDGLHIGAAACCHALLALGIHQIGVGAFLGGHRPDDRFHVDQHLVVHPGIGHRRLGFLHARHHARQHPQPAHRAHLLKLHRQVVEVELALFQIAGELFGVFFLDRRGRAFDQADNIAHAQNAVGNAGRAERFDRVELFTGAGKFDRLAGDRAHRKRRPAARIAVHASQHDAGQRHFLGEILRNVDRVLPGERIDHQQHFIGRRNARNGLHFGHQRIIDMQTACGVEQQHVEILKACGIHRAPGNIDRLLPGDDRQGGNLDLAAEHRELFLRCRSIDVERGHQRFLAVAGPDQLGELGGGGGFA